MRQVDTSDAFETHDHANCREKAMLAAEHLAAERKLRLTPVRRRVLEILLESHRAIGAYEVLGRLAEEGFGSQPPVAYRALEFLVEAGMAHRVQRLNAFAACHRIGEDHAPAFLICRKCRHISEAEAPVLRKALNELGDASGFDLELATIEAVGVCARCAASETDAA